MPKYINTEQIEQYLHREEFGTPDERWRPESEFAAIVDSIPAADVVEVKHGVWIIEDSEYEPWETYICPFCNAAFGYKLNFCGNCGADMRGETE